MIEHNHDVTGATDLYAVISNASGQRWNGTAFETLVVANWGTYDIPLSESPAGSYRYPVSVPAGINYPAVLTVQVYEQASGSPSPADTLLAEDDFDWNGSGVVDSPSPTLAEMTARTLPSAQYFDPASHAVARVTLVDTTTANSDMRGTDGANTTAPDNASVAAIKVKTDNLPASPAAVGSQMTLEDNAITAGKIATGALTAAKFASGAFDAVWSATARTLSGFGFTVTTDTASRNASKADVSGLQTSAQAALDKAAIQASILELNPADTFLVSHRIIDSYGKKVDACEVVITTTNTSDSDDVVASGYTNAGGKVEFRLPEGQYYLWRNKRRYQFDDPAEFSVGSDGVVTYT